MNRNATIGTVFGMLGVSLVIFLQSGKAPPPPPPRILSPREKAEQIAGKHLNWADNEIRNGLVPSLTIIHDFFSSARSGTRGFAEESLGWASKMMLVTDYLNGTKNHTKFLQASFTKRVLSADQLEKAIDVAVADYLHRLKSIDSELLVKLSTDLSDLPVEYKQEKLDRAAIDAVLTKAIKETTLEVQADLRGMILREIVSSIATSILTQATIQLATSAGILTASASSGVVTAGTGLVVGVATEYVVGYAYRQVFDPIGRMSNQISTKLNELQSLIVMGTEKSPGLESRFRAYAAERAKVRKAAIKDVTSQFPITVSPTR